MSDPIEEIQQRIVLTQSKINRMKKRIEDLREKIRNDEIALKTLKGLMVE